MARSAAIQYLGFRGVAVGIGTGKTTAREACNFSVNQRGSATKFYIDKRSSLSQAREQAVAHWD